MAEKDERKTVSEPPSTPPAITLELLKSTSDNHLDYVVFEYVNTHVFDVPGKFEAALARLPLGLKYCWFVNEINYQVLNGGFQQFFHNSSGIFALETLEALRAIGAKDAAAVLERAIALFEKKFDRRADSRERWYGIWQNDKSIDALDDQCSDLVESGAMSIAPYIRKHPELFLHERRDSQT